MNFHHRWAATALFVGVALVGITVPSYATTITFEEFGTKTCCFATEPPLTTQYSADGVTFSGGWAVLNQSGGFGVYALSGSDFAAYNTDVPGVTNTLELDFSSIINDVSGFVGNGLGSDWIINAFNGPTQVGNLVVSNAYGSYASFSLTGLSALGANRVTIQGSTFYGVLEDLTFTTIVPVPAAAWLFGSGLLGLIGMARRKAA